MYNWRDCSIFYTWLSATDNFEFVCRERVLFTLRNRSRWIKNNRTAIPPNLSFCNYSPLSEDLPVLSKESNDSRFTLMESSLNECSNLLIEKVETSIRLEVFWWSSLVAIIWGINTYDNHLSFCRSITIVGPISWLNLMTFILFIKNYSKLFFIALDVKMKLFTFWKLANMDTSIWAFLFLWLSNMT